MKKTILIVLLIVALSAACAPRNTAADQPLPAATQTGAPAATQTAAAPAAMEPAATEPAATEPSATEPASLWKPYTNSEFGLGFQYPSAWFGPDEYVSGSTLRVEVGSDVVYPYGTDRAEQIYNVQNAYYVLVQYTKNDQNTYWKDTYQSLVNLQDGEQRTDARNLVIRVRALSLGRFEGIEFISTLSETAQTEPVYIRQVILFDDQANVLSMMGQPNNVAVDSGAGWREAYRMVDAANVVLFHQMVASLTLE